VVMRDSDANNLYEYLKKTTSRHLIEVMYTYIDPVNFCDIKLSFCHAQV
jgi:hypothetical protein